MIFHLVLLVLFMAHSFSLGTDLGQYNKTEEKISVDNVNTSDAIINVSSEMQGANVNQTLSTKDANKVLLRKSLTKTKELTNFSTGNSTKSPETLSTTQRILRNMGTAPNRNNKLFSVLAERQDAYKRRQTRPNQQRFRSRNNTYLSISPPTTGGICLKNCTHNFTQRARANCIRRCFTLHRMTTTTTTTTKIPKTITTLATSINTTNTTLKTISTTKKDIKDINEILSTDESSHGFLTIAKDLNDTSNHIASEIKQTFLTPTEKSYNKQKYKTNQTLSNIQITNPAPYLYFGQKLPPIRPTTLKITKIDKINLSTTSKPLDRENLRNKYYQRRNLVAFNRRYGLSETTKLLTTNNNITTEINISGSDIITEKTKFIENITQIPIKISRILTRATRKPFRKDKDIYRNQSIITSKIIDNDNSQIPQITTPLLINVAEIVEQDLNETIIKKFSSFNEKILSTYPPLNVPEETPNLIIFFDVTTPSIKEKTNITTTGITFITPKTTVATKTTTTTTQSSEKLDTLQPTKISVKTTISSSLDEKISPNSTLSIEINRTTKLESTTINSTTIKPTIQIETTSESISSSSTTKTNKNLHETIDDDDDTFIFGEEVTVEAHRINIATYILAGLGMVPIIVIILYMAKTLILNRANKDDEDFDHFVTDGEPIAPVRKINQSDDDNLDQYSTITEQEFDRNNIRFKSLLGEGNFGQVWKAEVDDLAGHIGTTRIVAVKIVRFGSSQTGLKEEAAIMRKLGSHINVVTLLGTCLDSEPHLLIIEYAMRGRLLSLLRAARSATNILPASVPGGKSLAPLSPRTLAGFCLDIARGMEYIADRRIVHRDLAARNVLLDHNGVCKICDFGMSLDLDASKKSERETKKSAIENNQNENENRFRFDFGGRLLNQWTQSKQNIINNNINNSQNIIHDKKHNHHDSVSRRPALPIRWMAPEALQYHIFTIETDVWAFGIVLWEIATLGCTPYPNLSGREVVRLVPAGKRPELPQGARSEFYNLMTRCWRKDTRQRPTFKEARIEISRTLCKWVDDDSIGSDYMDVSGFSEDLEHGMVYFNRRISEFECEI